MTNPRITLNAVDFMIASLYLYYRKREDHFLSAFWAKFYLAIVATFFIFVPMRLTLHFVPLNWRCSFNDYFLLIFLLLWGIVFTVLIVGTIKFSVLDGVELADDDYHRGNRLVTIYSVICFALTGAVAYLTGPIGEGC